MTRWVNCRWEWWDLAELVPPFASLSRRLGDAMSEPRVGRGEAAP